MCRASLPLTGAHNNETLSLEPSLMTSKSSDFYSLLSDFRDATRPKANKISNVPRETTQVPKSDSRDHVSENTDASRTGDESVTTTLTVPQIEPTRTKDPSYSASLMRDRIERLIRIHQIRQPLSINKSGENGTFHCRDNETETVHIAVCATIVDDFPHEKIWRKWIEETGGIIEIPFKNATYAKDVLSNDNSKICNDVSTLNSNEHTQKSDPSVNFKEGRVRINASADVFVHAKFPEKIQSDWLRSKTLPVSHRPNWNDVRIVRAMLSLLQTALFEKKTTHILFCTESCIPIVTLQEAACSILLDKFIPWEDRNCQKSIEQLQSIETNASLNWDRSFIDCYDNNSSRCSRFDEHNCWGTLNDAIPGGAIYKALPGWCFLSRKHAQNILDLPLQLGCINLWPAFENVWAPEEVYFPTVLNLCGSMNEVVRRSLTHSKWDEKAANLQDRAHPICYDKYFNSDLVRKVRQDGCLFLRKLKQPIDVQLWEDIVIHRLKSRATKIEEQRQRHKRERDWKFERNHSDSRMHRHGRLHTIESSHRRQSGHVKESSVHRENDQYWRRKRP